MSQKNDERRVKIEVLKGAKENNQGGGTRVCKTMLMREGDCIIFNPNCVEMHTTSMKRKCPNTNEGDVDIKRKILDGSSSAAEQSNTQI